MPYVVALRRVLVTAATSFNLNVCTSAGMHILGCTVAYYAAPFARSVLAYLSGASVSASEQNFVLLHSPLPRFGFAASKLLWDVEIICIVSLHFHGRAEQL
jgi:hypothetical protein